MTSSPSNTPQKPSKLTPKELLTGSALMAVFAGIVLIISTRDWVLTLIAVGIVFVVGLALMAFLSRNIIPNSRDIGASEHVPHR
ncbi:ABC transporter ATP-binding protein [Leucobacter sp. M11]|uniref:ABC transporter ATP-binding protein n=1 Tax=Leucobacter sp. M11 TaxID=2993565 RepID=UPI002D80DC82|nr:ABC transporter ATP-binding protein [Leucobacter sp. M11]MEB4614868.1 ABC transporter ATP-binding protein [Leucobacter sp. M11]